MRIHLSLDPGHLAQPVAGPSSGPLVNIGGDLVLIELQGELNHEGDNANGVVGILGLDRPVSRASSGPNPCIEVYIPRCMHNMLIDGRTNQLYISVNIIYYMARSLRWRNRMLSFDGLLLSIKMWMGQ